MGIKFQKDKSMKFAAILALASSASAQITFCSGNGDCPAEALEGGGCCQTMEITAVPADAEWGFIQKGVFQGAAMNVGDTTSICMNAAMVSCRAEAEKAAGGPIDNMTDLQCFIDSNPGIDQALELDDNTVDALIDKWGSNLETNEGFFLKTYCAAGAEKVAVGA